MPTNQELAIMKPEAKEMQEVFRENLAGGTISRFDLETIKIPSGGDTKWVIEDADGTKMMDNFTGIIVKAHNTRAYWKPDIDDEGNEKDVMGEPPDCASDDGMTGSGSPGGECSVCKWSQWDTGKKGRGQACKLMRTLFILKPSSYLPAVMNCPPSSYPTMHKYFTSLTTKGHRYSDVVTEFALEGDKNPDGFKYAKVIPTVSRVLTTDEHEIMKSFIGNFVSAIQKKVDTSDCT